MRLIVAPDGLLAQKVKRGGFPAIRSLQTDIVVADPIRRPDAEHGVRGEQIFRDYAIQQFFGVPEQVPGRFADLRILQYRRVFTGQSPGDEERRPVDIAA